MVRSVRVSADRGVSVHRVTRFTLTAFIALLLVVSAIAAPASAATRSAVPEVTCSGLGCDGQWPDISGCAATAITAEYANIYHGGTLLGQVQLRYSTACRTVWGRILDYVSTCCDALVQRTTGGTEYLCNILKYSSSLGANSCYTKMLYDGGYTAYAGGLINDGSGSFGADTLPY